MKVGARYAEEHFADLVSAVDSGEEVRTARPDTPGIRLVADEAISQAPRRPRAELWGAWEGKIVLPTDAEWQAMDKEIKDEMLNGPIFPEDHASGCCSIRMYCSGQSPIGVA